MKKLELFEVQFLKEAVEGTTIKAVHAPQVAGLIVKLNEELNRLKELEDKK